VPSTGPDVFRQTEAVSGSRRFIGPVAFAGPVESVRTGRCPCGSGRGARGCHADRTQDLWLLPASAPLLSGPRSGHRNERCYAAASEDCSPKVSREHWLSADILRTLTHGKTVTVEGAPWQRGRRQEFTPKALAANVLCERHNNGLAPLDAVAGRAFDVLRRYQADQRTAPAPRGSQFALVSGEDLQRWLLKVLWGATAAGAFADDGKPVRALNTDNREQALVDYLFRGGRPLPCWDLHLSGRPEQPVAAEAEVGIYPQMADGQVQGITVSAGVIGLRLSLTTPEVTAPFLVRRPRRIELASDHAPAVKALALAWGGGDVGEVARLARMGITRDAN
jgi:hypothetical protein